MKRHCEQKGRIKRLGEAICPLYCRVINAVRLLLRQLTDRNDEKPNRLCENKGRHPIFAHANKYWENYCEYAIFGGRSNPLIIILILVLFSPSANSTVITVKQDGSGNFTTIQAGINAAATSDTVLVYPGTYFENINYNSKSITVASLYLTTLNQSYIHSTIIDGNMNGSCVIVINCTGENNTICGFTVQHGSGYSNLKYGGGLHIDGSKLKINCLIIKNNHARRGGGIFCKNSNVLLSGTIVKSNIAFDRTGGIYLVYDNNFIFDNENLSSVYLNYGPIGCDISKSPGGQILNIILDTATVLNPDYTFFCSTNNLGYPVYDLLWQINHCKVEQINANLYVNPDGDNSNSGVSPDMPLKNLTYALKKILPDTINPKCIFLSDGVYSPTTNDEVFPVITRSFVSIIGENVDATILDAEYIYPLLNSYLFTKSFTIENITFRKGTDSQAVNSGNGGFNIGGNDSVLFSNIVLEEVESNFYSGLFSNFSNISIFNSKIINNSGGYALSLFNTQDLPIHYRILNTIVSYNNPSIEIDEGFGGSIGISGSYSFPNSTKATLINVINIENTYNGNPSLIDFGICGLSCNVNSCVIAVNTTIANNVVINPVPSSQVYAGEGAKISFYNSIVYGTEDYEIFLGDGTPTSDIATVNISNTNVKGGESNIQNWNNIHNLNWLDGNIDQNPLWEGGDPFSYALQPGSPCINAGVPMFEEGMDYPYIKELDGKYVLYMLDGDTVTLPATDLAGNQRISGGRIDMGAYEWQDTTTGITNIKYRMQKADVWVYPNPFKSNVFIGFMTEAEQWVDLDVTDLQGQRIRTITTERFPAGKFRLVWDGKDDEGLEIRPGNYLVCLYLNSKLVSCEKILKTVK